MSNLLQVKKQSTFEEKTKKKKTTTTNMLTVWKYNRFGKWKRLFGTQDVQLGQVDSAMHIYLLPMEITSN